MVLKIRPQSDSVFYYLEPVVLTHQNREPTTVYINPTNPKFKHCNIISRLQTPLSYNFTWNWFGCPI
jgi:hypothetical protein